MLLALITTRPACPPSLMVLTSSPEDSSLDLVREMAEESRSFGVAATVSVVEDFGVILDLQRTDALRDICQYAGRTGSYDAHTARMLDIIAKAGTRLAV